MVSTAQLRRWYGSVRNRRANDVLDRLVRSLVDPPVLKLPDFAGSFAVPATSDLVKRVAFTGCYEPGLAEAARSVELGDRDAIDVGANVGFFTVLFATLTRGRPSRVLAFEPVEAVRALLQENVIRNSVEDRVIVLPVAAGSSDSSSSMNVVVGNEEYSTLSSLAHPAAVSENVVVRRPTVDVRTVDSVVAEFGLRPALLKVDVEGWEFEVLEGARATLARYSPTVLIEVSDAMLRTAGRSASGLLQFLDSLEYDCWPIEPTAGTDLDGNYRCESRTAHAPS